jgi:hypothetical protein
MRGAERLLGSSVGQVEHVGEHPVDRHQHLRLEQQCHGAAGRP